MDNCTLDISDQWISAFPTEEKLLLEYRPSIIYTKFVFYSIYAIFGIFGNTLSSIIWLLPDLRKKNNSAYYLAFLGITDAIITIFILLIFFMGYFGRTLDPRLSVLNNALQYFSVSLVFGFTLERWISVCFPFKRQKLCTSKRTFLAIGILLLISIVMATIAFIIVSMLDNQAMLILNEVLYSIIVPSSALLMNVKVIFEMKRITQAKSGEQNEAGASKENQNFLVVTTMLVTLSMYVIICNLIAGSFYVRNQFLPDLKPCFRKEELQAKPEFIKNYSFIEKYQIFNILTLSHYALNCFIYFLTNANYRRKVMSLICRILRCRRSDEKQLVSSTMGRNSRRRQNRSNLLNTNSTTSPSFTSPNDDEEDALQTKDTGLIPLSV